MVSQKLKWGEGVPGKVSTETGRELKHFEMDKIGKRSQSNRDTFVENTSLMFYVFF